MFAGDATDWPASESGVAPNAEFPACSKRGTQVRAAALPAKAARVRVLDGPPNHGALIEEGKRGAVVANAIGRDRSPGVLTRCGGLVILA